MNEIFVTINGVGYTKAEYAAYKRARRKANPTPKKRKPTPQMTLKQAVGEEIALLMKDIKVIDSLIAFNRNGYRQWGTIHTQVMDLRQIATPFNNFLIHARKLNEIAKELTTLAKRSSRQIPQLLERFGWEIEDTKESLKTLLDGIGKSQVLHGLQNCEVICANGKRLGLKVLTIKANKALIRMEKAIPSVVDMLNDL